MAGEQLITDHVDLWTAAIKRKSTAGRGSSSKIELYGIKKLRELILELAVRGLLVPQDPNDEPASELLKNIVAEKARLVKEGKIKKDKPLPLITEEEKPFDLPSGWEWSRLQDVSEYIQRGKGPVYADSGRVKVVSQKCVQWSGFDISASRFVDDESLSGYKQERFLKNQDLLWNSTGTGTVGRINAVERVPEQALVADSHVTVVRVLGVHAKYCRTYISSPGVQIRIEPAHEASLVSGSTQQVELNTSAVVLLPVPVPPLDEQHRIVAKADELMALCDQLEEQTNSSRSAHQTLVEAFLNALTSAADHAQFTSAWQGIAEHFDTLFTTEESINQLKQTILQLAVMGMLVPQDPNDEPASELLKKIAAEKAKLMKEGVIKNHLPVEPMGKSQALPATWVEIVVQDFADIRLGSTPSRTESKFWNGDIPWVSSGEVANCIIRDTSEKITQEGLKKSSASMIPARSLLMAIIGQGKTRGQTALLEINACTNQNVAAFVFNEQFIFPEYVWIWAKSKYESHRDDGHGGAQPALNGKKVRSFRFPLAPIEEQHRIVAKVDELIALCDWLKFRLNDAQTNQLHLADTLAEKALARP